MAACSTPGAYFRDVPPTRVSVAGSDFDIRVRGRLAEAIRTNPQYAPRAGPLFAQAEVAMEHVSGCNVDRIGGDQAQITGILDCGARGDPVILAARYDCVEVQPSITEGYLDYECEPY